MSGSKVDAKVVLLGKEYGGKTSLVERYLHDKFSGEMPYQNTIGSAYGSKRQEVYGTHVVFGIWDTAGSERYQAMSRIYYRGAWAAIVCFDLTDRSSWEKAKFWALELRQQEPLARIYFVGTKRDKLDDDPELRQVKLSEIRPFTSIYSSAEVFETSSKTNLAIPQLFQQIAKDFIKHSAATSPAASDETTGVGGGSDYFQVSDNNSKSEYRSKCSC